MILCVAANPSIDKLFQVDRVRPGRIHRPLAFLQVPGGKGLNVARVAAALGADVLVAGLLAGHAGRWIEEALASEGVQALFAWAAGETRDSLSVADRETGSLTEFYEAGTPVGPEDWPVFEALVGSVLRGRSWITMSGSLPAGAPVEGYANLIRTAAAAGVRSAVDTPGRPLEVSLRASAELVKINRAEARVLLGEDPAAADAEEASRQAGDDWALDAAATIRERAGGHVHAAVVTLGVDGAVMAGPDGHSWRGSVEALGPYPVGSGDAFLAGLVTALDRGGDWPEALALAFGAAAANAEMAGAGRLDPARARALAAAARVRQIA